MNPKQFTISIILAFILLPLYLSHNDSDIQYNYLPINDNKELTGEASYYDYELDNGWSSIGHYVCATRNFVRYSMVRATNVANGKSVDCKVTDYGPDESIFPNRIIDLSSTAFASISDLKSGVIAVKVEQL